MEALPLEKIVKKDDVYEFYINDPQRNKEELMFKDNRICNYFYTLRTLIYKISKYLFCFY